uniref:Putative secreted protein n=1 Tax=Anopheles darlingi TaxID=43151 RepID=A0A2M4D8F2_ANODA
MHRWILWGCPFSRLLECGCGFLSYAAPLFPLAGPRCFGGSLTGCGTYYHTISLTRAAVLEDMKCVLISSPPPTTWCGRTARQKGVGISRRTVPAVPEFRNLVSRGTCRRLVVDHHH